MPTRLRIVLLCLALSLAAATPSRAQLQESESADYRALVEQALGEYAGRNYEEAGALFARAHQLSPNARTLRGMGMADFELRRYPESVAHLQAALASQVKPLDPPLRSETEALLTRARFFVATVTVDVQPPSAELWLGGERVEAATPLPLSLGEHTFELRQSGYVSERRVVRLGGGEVQHIQLQLLRDGALAQSSVEQRGDRRPLYKSPWLWTGVGAVVAGALVASVLLATRGDDTTRVVGEGTARTPPGVFVSTLGAR